MSRLILFLVTAFPVLLLALIPNLENPCSPLRRRMTKCVVWYLFPFRFRLTKSPRFNNLWLLGNEKARMHTG